MFHKEIVRKETDAFLDHIESGPKKSVEDSIMDPESQEVFMIIIRKENTHKFPYVTMVEKVGDGHSGKKLHALAREKPDILQRLGPLEGAPGYSRFMLLNPLRNLDRIVVILNMLETEDVENILNLHKNQDISVQFYGFF